MAATALGYGTGRVALLSPSLNVTRVSSRCSHWITGLEIRRFQNTLSRKAAVRVLEPSSSRRDRFRVFAVGGEASPHGPPQSIPLDPTLFDEQTYLEVKKAYSQELQDDIFEGAGDLKAEWERQKVIKNLVHERFEPPEFLVDDRPIQTWDVLKKAPGIVGAALAMFMFFNVSGPAKPTAIKETPAYRRSVRAPSRRGRKPAQQQEVQVARPLLKAVLGCTAIAMIVQMLKDATGQQSQRLVHREPKPYTTVIHLNVGVLGTATSLRWDLLRFAGKDEMPGQSSNSELLADAAGVLMGQLEHIAYAGREIEHAESPSQWQTFVNNWQLTDHKRICDAPMGERLRGIYEGYGHKVEEGRTLIVDSMKVGYTVVTLTCAVKGHVSLPQLDDTLDLHFWLSGLALVDPDNIEYFNMKWTPTEGETLPEETMHRYFPRMGLLANKEDLEKALAEEGMLA